MCYIPPVNSTSWRWLDPDIWDTLEEEVGRFSRLGEVILVGDFNARTGISPDTATFDEDGDSYLPIPPECFCQMPPLERVSQDTENNEHGMQLLNLCKASGLRIVNGRLFQDKGTGKFTCHTARGNSVVDYVIASQAIMNDFASFQVGEISLLSDHCPVEFSLEIDSEHARQRVQSREEPDCEEAHRYKWIEDKAESFQDLLKNVSVGTKLDSLMSNLATMTSDEAATKFTELLLHAGVESGALRKKTVASGKKGGHFPSNEWFDSECKCRKREINKLLKLYNANPSDVSLRSLFWDRRKAWRILVRRKKRQATYNLNSKLQSLRAKPKEFWKLINLQ